MSPEAVAYLEAVPNFRVPEFAFRFLATPARVPAIRKQFQDDEDVIEQSLIVQHGLTVEHIEIAGVPVTRVTPPAVDPQRHGAIVFNIHGGGFVLGTGRERKARPRLRRAHGRRAHRRRTDQGRDRRGRRGARRRSAHHQGRRPQTQARCPHRRDLHLPGAAHEISGLFPFNGNAAFPQWGACCEGYSSHGRGANDGR